MKKMDTYQDYLEECKKIDEKWDKMISERPDMEDRRQQEKKELYEYNGGICKMRYA